MEANWITSPAKTSCCSFLQRYSLQKRVKKAVIRITAMGWYNLFVNGNRVDNTAFAPGWTSYLKRVQFNEYVITDLVKDAIDLKVDVGEGWGGSDRFAWTGGNYIYFPMSLNYEVVVEFEDGDKGSFVSDESVKVFTNEVIDCSIYYGETQDQFAKIKELGNAKRIEIDSKIISNEGLPIVFGECIPAYKVFKDNNGDTIVDFGQNFAGIVEIRIKAKKGDVISYTPGEVLDKNGKFYNANYRKCSKSKYSFVCSGGDDIFRPRFSFMGGRYIKLIDCPIEVGPENFTAILIHSDLRRTCLFECQNRKINRLFENTKYGLLSNYIDVPTDCPQRDERLGWTADAQVFASTAAIEYDVRQFFAKWLHDMELDQLDSGAIPSVVPAWKTGSPVSTGWGDACCIIPLEMYRAFGDKKILEDAIPMMEKWVTFLLGNCKKPYIVELPFSFGDWLALDKVMSDDKENCSWQGITRFDLMSSAFLCLDLGLIIEAKKALGFPCNNEENLLMEARKAYQNEFIRDGHLIGEKALLFSGDKPTCYTQTGLAMTLHFGLCEENDRQSLGNDLVDLIKECGGKMTTGFIGTAYILDALKEIGRADVAYDLIFQEEYPSWLYSVNKGATTMWEHYDGIKEDGSFWFDSMNSYNHYAYGAVFGFIFRTEIGIKPLKPGYEQILIEPIIDKRFGSCDGRYHAPRGDVRVLIKVSGGEALIEIEMGRNDCFVKILNKDLIHCPTGGRLSAAIAIKG